MHFKTTDFINKSRNIYQIRRALTGYWVSVVSNLEKNYYARKQTRCGQSMPKFEFTPVTIQYIHPPHHGHE